MSYRSTFAALPILLLVATAASAGPGEGRAWGDIHVETMDGTIYPFQLSGEYFASRSQNGDLEVQLRLESAGFQQGVSIATAVAIRVDTTRASVALGRKPLLFVDDRPTSLSPGDTLELPDGGWITRKKKAYEIFWSDGSMLTVDVKKSHLNAYLRPAETRRDTLEGLFGNFNGDPTDDLDATTAAAAEASLTASQLEMAGLVRRLLGDDATDWLLAQEESLFEYEPGQSTRSFRRQAPRREASARALPASRRRQAQEVCEKAGVTEGEYLQACIVDVGYTRDESFAETAAEVQARDVEHWDEKLTRKSGAGF